MNYQVCLTGSNTPLGHSRPRKNANKPAWESHAGLEQNSPHRVASREWSVFSHQLSVGGQRRTGEFASESRRFRESERECESERV